MRAYTVAEIDRIRSSVYIHLSRQRFLQGPTFATEVEEQVRTLMLGGVDPADVAREYSPKANP